MCCVVLLNVADYVMYAHIVRTYVCAYICITVCYTSYLCEFVVFHESQTVRTCVCMCNSIYVLHAKPPLLPSCPLPSSHLSPPNPPLIPSSFSRFKPCLPREVAPTVTPPPSQWSPSQLGSLGPLLLVLS